MMRLLLKCKPHRCLCSLLAMRARLNADLNPCAVPPLIRRRDKVIPTRLPTSQAPRRRRFAETKVQGPTYAQRRSPRLPLQSQNLQA